MSGPPYLARGGVCSADCSRGQSDRSSQSWLPGPPQLHSWVHLRTGKRHPSRCLGTRGHSGQNQVGEWMKLVGCLHRGLWTPAATQMALENMLREGTGLHLHELPRIAKSPKTGCTWAVCEAQGRWPEEQLRSGWVGGFVLG